MSGEPFDLVGHLGEAIRSALARVPADAPIRPAGVLTALLAVGAADAERRGVDPAVVLASLLPTAEPSEARAHDLIRRSYAAIRGSKN